MENPKIAVFQVLKLILLLPAVVLVCCQGPQGNEARGSKEAHAFTNHLANESSPYLLQHAHNPVDWYPWGEQALNKAQEENKLIILSVGYAACHWCHVMEDESFADSAVASVMNENFVSIKVDREERPDVDKIYMDASYLMTGRGGWPLNVIALPDGRPIFAGTYFPKKDWMKILERISAQYQEAPELLVKIADQVTEGIQTLETVGLNTESSLFSDEQLTQVHGLFMKDIDTLKGGRLGSQKFPTPSIWQYLLRYHFFTKDPVALQAVNKTLKAMAHGGIYDHLGGGFARYATDPDWHVPHFEKMLYDNAQLISLYSRAYQLTKDPLYQTIVHQTAAFVEREMTSEQGAFYSSYDADSEGEEGKFYVWTANEIDELLGDRAAVFKDYYQITNNGNWEQGKNILVPTSKPQDLLQKYDLEASELEETLEKARARLFKVRKKRVAPALDDKVLTSWNALMISGYLDAYRVFGEPRYLQNATKNAEFLLENMRSDDGRLNRNYKDGKSSINAFLDDYSHTIQALIGLYEATFQEQWLLEAKSLTDYVLTHFDDAESGMFFYTSDEDPALLTRKMELSDNVIPSSNSSMATNLYLLGTYLYEEDYLAKAKQMVINIQDTMLEQPVFYSNWAILMHLSVQPL